MAMIRRVRTRASSVALVLATIVAVACSDTSSSGSTSLFGSVVQDTRPDSAANIAPSDSLFVSGPPPASIAPGADPTTALGALRAQHLPVWDPELDWAFPPLTCNSAWELDAIAEADPTADAALLDDLTIAAALAVMRYEYLNSRALHNPTPLAQLCVAVSSVAPVRSENLTVLASYLSESLNHQEPAAYPQQVIVLATGDSGMLAVACVSPGYPTVVSEGEVTKAPAAPVRLQSYRLALARGLEDAVTDVSLRVSQAVHRPAQSCAEMDTWIPTWQRFVTGWIDEGQIWEPLDATVTVDQVCVPQAPDIPTDCPRDWPIGPADGDELTDEGVDDP